MASRVQKAETDSQQVVVGMRHDSHFSPSPRVLTGQVQVKLPNVLVQVAAGSHGGVALVHSSMSVHVRPSPANPVPQVQVKLPGVFVQNALASQPPLFVRHSSTSVHAVPSPVKPALQA